MDVITDNDSTRSLEIFKMHICLMPLRE